MKNFSKILFVIIVVLLGIYAFNFYKVSNIKNLIYLPPKEVKLYDSNSVFISGNWIPQGDTKTHFFGEKEVNTTEMWCHKDVMQCIETRAVISYLDGMLGSQKYGFYAFNFEYEIKEWTENYIKAEYKGIGRDFFVTINLKNQTASIDIKDNQDNPTASIYTDTAALGE